MEQCIFKNKNCGIHKPSRDPRVLFCINESDKNCKNHLVSIKILQSYDETADITEKELIESRSNKSLDNHQSDKICNYHRYEYGVYWRPSRKCQHPLHTKKGKCNTRTGTFSQISCLQQNFSENHFPIGCQLCMTHIKETNKMMKESENNDNSVVSEYTEIFEAEALSQEEIENAENTHSSLVEALDITPPWKVKQKVIADMTNNSMRTIKSNYKKAKLALKNKFIEAVAPGQSFVLADMLSDDENNMLDETINQNLKAIKDIYKSSDNFGQLVILSFALQQYSKVNIMNYFDGSKRKVDNARKLYSLAEGISIPENKKHNLS